VAFSAVVGRKVSIRPKKCDDWLVVANLWGAIVGSPGLLKSPALKEALAPMNALIAKAIENHMEEVKEYDAEKEICEARREWFASEKKSSPRRATWQRCRTL
jgi:putative DNA primase/helicase